MIQDSAATPGAVSHLPRRAQQRRRRAPARARGGPSSRRPGGVVSLSPSRGGAQLSPGADAEIVAAANPPPPLRRSVADCRCRRALQRPRTMSLPPSPPQSGFRVESQASRVRREGHSPPKRIARGRGPADRARGGQEAAVRAEVADEVAGPAPAPEALDLDQERLREARRRRGGGVVKYVKFSGATFDDFVP